MSAKTFILSAILVCSSTAAIAQPTWHQPYDRDQRTDEDRGVYTNRGPRYYEGGQWGDPRRYDRRNGLQLVASIDQPFDTARDGGGPIVIDLGRGVPMRKLVIQSTGYSEIYNIRVFFADGTSSTFKWNHAFNAPSSDGQQGPRLVMNTTGRVATRLVITGRNSPNTRMSVMLGR